MKIEIEGEELQLLPEKAVLWQTESLLALSDVHLGKAESMQFHGVPAPSGSHFEDLDKLSDLVDRHQVKKVFILGDWIHQRNSWTPALVRDLQDFFAVHSKIHWTLLLGNHERGSLSFLEQFPMELVHEEKQVGPFLMTHGHHPPQENVFQIQGHIHPIVNLRQGPLRMRLPCFVLQPKNLVLPSFGTLTGGHAMSLSEKDRAFAVGPKDVFEVRL